MRLAAAIVLLALGGTVAVAGVDLRPEAGEDRPGGEATSVKPRNRAAFSNPSGNMSFQRQFDFKVGDGVFRKLWVSAPSSTKGSDGLGPLLNARSCQSCHLRDGRGRPPAPGEPAVSLLMKLSRPSGQPEPNYGGQLQTFAIQGHAAEGAVRIEYEETPVRLSDGPAVSLREPRYSIVNLGYGPIDVGTLMSPRVAPPMIGLGLLELIPEEDILARADPRDGDGDGTSGAARRVWSRAEGREMLGRFGWKAGAATVADQAADAFANDMGLSTPLVRSSFGECTAAQAACRAAPAGEDPMEGVEVPSTAFDLVVFYARNLGVPARVDAGDPHVLRGKQIFSEIGCAACHVPRHVTGTDPERPGQSGQTIWPYTDLLLHDMGDGLADNRPDGTASGREWRTPPLWGLGLTELVSDHTYLLHDGRARNVLEAILWHDGEAQAARDRAARCTAADRSALLAFLASL
jgi:CxxC motif-containing protein (DUF1111 family)